MPGLLIKNVPRKLTLQLKHLAVRHHRSMTREALAILEQGIESQTTRTFAMPVPFKAKFPITREFINRAKRQGRE